MLTHRVYTMIDDSRLIKSKGKGIPIQAWTDP